MIVELFGAPGAGKTTFARALAARLRERGYTVDLILSHRPAERSSRQALSGPDPHPRRQILPMARRVIRPIAEMLTMVRHPLAVSRDVRAALSLIRILPPSDTLWSLRMTQYLLRLSRAWLRAANTGHIVLFDQAFVQAVCSLALLCGATDDLLISQVLDEIPQSSLLVLLKAPINVVESRLRDRAHRASRMERLLELDLATNLKSLSVVESLHEMLRKKGKLVMNVTSLDQYSLHQSVERIEKQITAQYDMELRAATRQSQTGSDLFRADRSVETPTQPPVEGH
jgi:thymidylate kinase